MPYPTRVERLIVSGGEVDADNTQRELTALRNKVQDYHYALENIIKVIVGANTGRGSVEVRYLLALQSAERLAQRALHPGVK